MIHGSTMLMVALLTSATIAYGQSGNLKMLVEGTWGRRAAMIVGGDPKAGSGNSAVYATLVNSGAEPDALIAATTNVAGSVEIHETYRDRDMMMMRPVRKIDIPANGKVQMKPGGYHIMLLDIKRDLKAGETISVSLQFAKAGTIPVIAAIK